ncbi:MAG: hypothetical protein QM523_01800 [Candidatus Pacebacteria bacterium]|nr:hypothetical protein [Candidatus Paceibacterota bacterium]
MKIHAIGHGQVFAVEPYLPLNSAVGFAQSPHAIVLDDRIRVYYSTRKLSPNNGKYLSQIAFVDYSLDLKSIIYHSRNPVLSLGRTGCFDEHGIFPLHVLRHGGRILGYSTGLSRRISVPIDAAIGLVESFDGGDSFVRHGDGPVMSASLHEPFMIGDAFVLSEANKLKMWYIFGQRWLEPTLTNPEPERVYKIAQCESPDGLHWVGRSGTAIIPDQLGIDECQALPTVTKIDGGYLMVFCFREAVGFRTDPKRGYRLGTAYSRDGQAWNRSPEPLEFTGEPGAWNSDMQCYPNLFWHQQKLWLLYNGNEFGRHGFGLAELICNPNNR